MPLKKRTKFYLGLIIITIAILFLAYVLYSGPHTKIPETKTEIIYDHPHGPVFQDIQSGDQLELNFESDLEVNVLLMKTSDASDYFNNPASNVKPITLDTDSSGGYFMHTFNSSGDWGLYFENPSPPPSPKPNVKYWGELIKGDDDYLYYYLKISMAIIVLVLGAALLYSSHEKRFKKYDKTKTKKEK